MGAPCLRRKSLETAAAGDCDAGNHLATVSPALLLLKVEVETFPKLVTAATILRNSVTSTESSGHWTSTGGVFIHAAHGKTIFLKPTDCSVIS